MIISFRKTVEAIRMKTKTVTRRDWKESHAAKFKPGMIVDAWTAGPHRKGEPICKIRITKLPYRQRLGDMPNDHFKREGGRLYWRNKAEYIEAMGGADKIMWVLEFDYKIYEDIGDD